MTGVGVRPDCQSRSNGSIDARVHGQRLGSAVFILVASPPPPWFLQLWGYVVSPVN